jgi:hypothetical protein
VAAAPVSAEEQTVEEDKPLTFALSSDEDIQK